MTLGPKVSSPGVRGHGHVPARKRGVAMVTALAEEWREAESGAHVAISANQRPSLARMWLSLPIRGRAWRACGCWSAPSSCDGPHRR
ncbi:hypothetical protein EYF80_011609 [Liparis tanakae]|uniref:Uncharacterized protein n=1 Tax=Liparis tanakae TaxID=230148 RepID=A0A4Z2IKU4_9TELE|nr:hypothetical protein EYF80_011609 [Liparis tanakae]